MKQKILGTLLPLFALPSADFVSAQKFLIWLKQTGQSSWLLLPLHETQLEKGSSSKHVPSPYKSYGVGLDPRYQSVSGSAKLNDKILKKKFVEKHKDWIHDYVLFCSLRDHFGTDDWSAWPPSIRRYEEDAVKDWTAKLVDSIAYHIEQQWQLHENYGELHKKAAEMGIFLIGDLPFYPSFRSPLVWAHQDVFQINHDGSMPFVSGIPDTAATHFGRQIWGHPLYNWDFKQEKVIAFWKLRLSYLATIFDHMRFDHAKAFFAYGVMDVGNAKNDSYKDGPGEEVFKQLVKFSQKEGLTIFAEDSGDKTEGLRRTLKEIAVPGLRIFRFALKGDEFHPQYVDINNYPQNCVASTTTHDTETLLGYLHSISIKHKKQLAEHSGVAYTNDTEFARNIRNAIIASPAMMVIIPIQDWLLSTSRINVPGTEKEIGDTNWHYKLPMTIEELPIDL